MSTEKHTPGPWQAKCRDVGYVDGQDWPEDEFLQWEVGGPRVPSGRGEFFQADALLIAAAPELLQCLRAVEVLFAPHCKDSTQADWLDKTQNLLRRLGAA